MGSIIEQVFRCLKLAMLQALSSAAAVRSAVARAVGLAVSVCYASAHCKLTWSQATHTVVCTVQTSQLRRI